MRSRLSSVDRLGAREREELERALDQRRLPFAELAELFGVSKSALHRHSQTRTPRPLTVPIDTLRLLAWAHSNTSGVPIDLIVDPANPSQLLPGPMLNALTRAT